MYQRYTTSNDYIGYLSGRSNDQCRVYVNFVTRSKSRNIFFGSSSSAGVDHKDDVDKYDVNADSDYELDTDDESEDYESDESVQNDNDTYNKDEEYEPDDDKSDNSVQVDAWDDDEDDDCEHGKQEHGNQPLLELWRSSLSR